MADKPIIITGPTASGKTSYALGMAKQLGGELINADSRQIYRGLDIGTDKGITTSESEIEGVPIHMMSFCKPDESYDVVQFVQQVEELIQELLDEDKLPIIVGGTGLYIDALIRGYIVKSEVVDSLLRDELNKLSVAELQQLIAPHVLAELNDSDRKNPRRLIRLIEKAEQRDSSEQKVGGSFTYDIHLLLPDIETLESRLKNRVQQMWQAGLVDEVKTLLDQGYTVSDPGLTSSGYREVASYLTGNLSEEECLEGIYIAHRQYAKRQLTWFKKYLQTKPLPIGNDLQVHSLSEH